MNGQRFTKIVPVALKEVLDAEYPKGQHDNVCRLHVLNESGAEIVNDSGDAKVYMLRIFPYEINEGTAEKEIKQRIYDHCVTARRARL